MKSRNFYLICRIVSTGLFCLPAVTGNAQSAREPKETRPFSVAVSFGITDIWGDIGPSHRMGRPINDLYFQQKPIGGAVKGGYAPLPWLGINLGVMYGRFYASDEFNKRRAYENPSGSNLHYLLYVRNLDVRTNIFETALTVYAEPLRIAGNSAAAQWRVQPFVEGGVGVFHFDPEGTYTDPVTGDTRWEKLQPLHLEGEGLDYEGAPKGWGRWQPAFPISGGLRYEASNRLAVSLAYTYRYTVTDYLDGVSGKYVDPAIFDRYLTPDQAVIARAMHDKGRQIDASISHAPGEIRGASQRRDGYSTFFLSVIYSIGQPRISNSVPF